MVEKRLSWQRAGGARIATLDALQVEAEAVVSRIKENNNNSDFGGHTLDV